MGAAVNDKPTMEVPADEAKAWGGDKDSTALVTRLAALPPLEYDQVRVKEATSAGVRVSTLDEAVQAARKKRQTEDGKRDMFPAVDPWPEPVEVAALFDELVTTIGRFIVCEPEMKVAATLWVAATWTVHVAQVAPIAFITAPEKRCGKSQLLDLIGRVCYRPLVASNISPAAVFRVIEAVTPTLLLDEADAFLRENEELRGVINSGHTRQSAYVIRTVGDDHEPTQFSTWGFKAIAGIGSQAGTIMDRSIVLKLRRKLPSEKTDRLRHAPTDLFPCLASKLARFAEDCAFTLRASRPALPDELNDRAQDNWEPLLAVADLAGPEWSQRARRAALIVSGAEQDAPSTSTELLSDIKEAFEQAGQAHPDGLLWTTDLLKILVSDESAPWATYHRGQPMTPRQLAKRLDEYGIKSANHKRPGSGVVKKGYRWSQFEDAFARYIPLSSEMPLSNRYAATDEDPQAVDGSGTVADAKGRATNEVAVANGGGSFNLAATENNALLLGGSGVADSREAAVGG
jgi:putative DNA primase/helicase